MLKMPARLDAPMTELSHDSAVTVIVACIVAAAIAFFVGIAVTALIKRLAARHGIRVERRSIWRAPLALLLMVLAVRGVLLSAGTQREWVHRAAYLLSLAAIAIAGWLFSLYGFVSEAQVQTAHAQSGILLTASIYAGLAFFASALCMLFYPISREMNRQIADELAARRSKFSVS